MQCVEVLLLHVEGRAKSEHFILAQKFLEGLDSEKLGETFLPSLPFFCCSHLICLW